MLHVASANLAIANEVAALREQTSAPIVLALLGGREGLVDEAMEAELSDILILPQPADVIAFSLRKAARDRAGGQAKASRVIMVSSTKGGTGKTSIAVNLLVGLVGAGLRTLLVDLDVQFGDVGIVLGLDRPAKTLHDLTSPSPTTSTPRSCAATCSATRAGCSILPAPLRPEEGEAIDATADRWHPADGAGHVRRDRGRHRSALRRPHAHGARSQRPVAAGLHAGRPVDEEHPPRAADARATRLSDRARRARRESRREWRAAPRRREMADTIGKEIRFVLPEDSTVPKSVNSGIPAVLLDPRTRFSRGIKDIVDALVGSTVVQPERGRRLRLPGATK